MQKGLKILRVALFGILTIVVIVGIVIFFVPEENEYSNENVTTPHCNNMSFYNTSLCLNRFVRSIFIYNITDDDIDLSLDELKSRGGDCKNWRDFYEKYMNYYNFTDNKEITGFIKKENETYYYHTFLISFNSWGYCKFDMRDLNCLEYG